MIEKNSDKKLANRISYQIRYKRCLKGKFGRGVQICGGGVHIRWRIGFRRSAENSKWIHRSVFGSNLYAPCICPLNTSFSFCIFPLFVCGYTLRSTRRPSLTSTFARLSKLFMKHINSPNTALPPAQKSRTLPPVSLDLCPFFHSRLFLNPQLGCFQFDQS